MAGAKTTPTKQTAASFIRGLPDAQTRKDCLEIAKLMQEATRAEPQMWGSSIVGFGTRHFKYPSGREGDWPVVAFSPRKQNLTLYLKGDFDAHPERLDGLGNFTRGKGCLYIKRLSDVDRPTLKKIIRASAKPRTDA